MCELQENHGIRNTGLCRAAWFRQLFPQPKSLKLVSKIHFLSIAVVFGVGITWK